MNFLEFAYRHQQGAVGVGLIGLVLVLISLPHVRRADRVVNEARDDIARGNLSDPDLMAVAKHVGGREYRP